MDKTIGNILRIGVAIAALLVFAGAIFYLHDYARPVPDYHVFHPDPYIPHVPRGGHGLIQLGLLALIFTPVARVIFSVFAFAHERDWTYVTISSIVLALLLFSLLAGTAIP